MIDFNNYPLSQAHEAQGIVVVIDVLRAFTTAAFAFDAGADKIYLVARVEEAIQLRDKIPGSLIMGEDKAFKPERFDFGNSPADISRIDLTDKTLIQRTSAGTQGIVRVVHADLILAASFVVAKATADYIRMLNPQVVSFIITGVSLGRDGDEDRACAEYIEALVKNKHPDSQEYIKRVRESSVGRMFLAGRDTRFQLQDLTLSIQVDRFPNPLIVRTENKRLVMDQWTSG
ncbi:MAG: 2-phosphosulfolactate phosphatase [Chloroflexota bacterium]|nr:2-phosphosulfolactate phosphatase [Chloroflexota bacterium]